MVDRVYGEGLLYYRPQIGHADHVVNTFPELGDVLLRASRREFTVNS